MRVTLTVNGYRRELELDPSRTLGAALREECGLTGTRLGCADGTCGACTVLVEGDAVRSCLMLAVQCEDAQVRTVEGLAADDPLRLAFPAASSATGDDCVAGLVMLAAGARGKEPGPGGDPEGLRWLLAANRCRCADHPVIRQAVLRAVADARIADAGGPGRA